MKKKTSIQQLNVQDEYFLDSDLPTAPTHIGGLEIYKLPAGAGRDFMQKLFTYWKNSPVRAEPFNYILSSLEEVVREEAGEKARWLPPLPRRRKKEPKPVRVWRKLDKVNVEEHLYLHALPKPGGQRELGELVARLHVNRLDRNRPLWEVHLIEGLEGGRYAIYTKLHHAQFDGKRGMQLTMYTRSTKASARGLPPLWAVQLEPPAKARGKAVQAAEGPGALKKLASMGKALQSIGAARHNEPGQGVIAPYSAPDSILNAPLTARRRLGTQSLSIPRIRALGAAIEGGATVNEVLLAICGGAMRRYLLDRDALPKDPLIAGCPVAVPRKDDGASGNAVGQINVSLGTNIANPKRRLLAVVESSRVNKGLMKDLGFDTHWLYTQLLMLPQVLAARTRYGHKVLTSNLVVSNVPGPRETQYVNGARLDAMYSASVLLPGQALNVTVTNFGDNLDVGIMACPDLVPSPQRIAVYIGEELEILEQAMDVRARGRKVASSPKPAPAKKPDKKRS